MPAAIIFNKLTKIAVSSAKCILLPVVFLFVFLFLLDGQVDAICLTNYPNNCRPVGADVPLCGPNDSLCTGVDESGATCSACVLVGGELPSSTCSPDDPVGGADCSQQELAAYETSGFICGDPTDCSNRYTNGCYGCAAPVCTPGNCYDGRPEDRNDIACAPCGTQTLAQINGQDSLTIVLDSNGTTYNGGQSAIFASGLTVASYNSFSSGNAIPNTSLQLTGSNGWFSGITCVNAQACSVRVPSEGSYILTAVFPQQDANGLTYPSSSDTATLVIQSPQSTVCGITTKTLTANGSMGTITIPAGGSAAWVLTTSPNGTSAVWRGTNNGADIGSSPVSGYPPSPWSATYTYSNSSATNSITYTRRIEITDSNRNNCTTNEINVIVQAQPPPQLKTCSASGQTGYCGNSSKQFPQNFRVNCGSGTLTYASSGDSSCGGGNYPYCYICLTPQQATDSCPDESGNPTGGCGNNNYGLLGQCSGTWTYPGIVSKNNYCSQKAGAARPFCYTCTPSGPVGGPSPTPGPISAGFTTGSIVVKGPLLLGRILQDINASFTIDSPDKLIEKITSIVSGKVLTILGLLDITGRIQNVLTHGSAVYHMWTNLCTFGCSADQQAVQQEIILATGGVSGSGASNFIKIQTESACTASYGTGTGCTRGIGSPGSYTKTTTYAQNPQQGFSARLIQSASFTQGYRNSTNSVYTDILSYIPTNVESKPCATGCTVQSKIELDYSTRQNSRVVSSSLNPDGTCFLKEEACPPDSCSGSVYTFDSGVNQTYTLTRETYYQGGSTTYRSNYYSNCTRYDIGRQERVTPWSVSFTSPVVVSSGSLAINNWYNLFDIRDLESCSYDANGQPQVNPASARQYCTCQLTDWCDAGGCTPSATFDCNYPLKSGKSFGDAPAGDYIFEITASTGSPINYEITAGGTLARGSQSPSGGKLSVKFNVPDSAIGQRINVALSQTGRDFEEVTFGAPALYPVGWYEANINFGRTARTGLSQARVIDPPDDYPYTIGMIPPAGNYCSKTSNLEQCYLSLSAAPLNSSNISQVDFLLGNLKAGGWFQVKDADLQAIGSLISRIPSSCKTPKCTPSFDLSGPGGFPGIPAYTNTSAFGSGTVSDKGWLAKSGYSGRHYNYNYFKSQVSSSKLIDLAERFKDRLAPDGSLSLNNDDLRDIAKETEPSFAVFSGKLTVERDTNLEGKKLVLFVGGDLNIKGQVNLKDGDGFFAAIVQGSINIDPSVVSQNPNQYGLEGVFLADGAIHTGTKNPIPGSAEADNQIYIRGMLAGWQGVILERDLDPTRSTGANNDKPAEFIEYAPDLVLNFPKELLRQGSVWREVAP